MLITTISVQEGKKFNLNQGMKGNIVKTHAGIVHEGMKQFKCDICNGKFRSKQIMIHHVATVHKENKHFNCESIVWEKV